MSEQEIDTDIEVTPPVDALDEAITKAMAGNTATAEVDTALEEIEAKDTVERVRDERGRFAPKAEEAKDDSVTATVSPEGEAAEAALKVEPPQATEQPQTAADASVKPDDPFRGWSKEEKAEFAKLPAEAQQFALRRQKAEREFAQSRFGEFHQYRETVKPLVDVATSNADYFRQNGVANPVEAIRNLISTEQGLRHGTWAQKQQIIDGLCRTYLGMPYEPPAVDEFVDDYRDPRSPHYAAWHDHNVRLQQIEQENRQLKSQFEQQETGRATSHVEEFAKATNPDGSPAHPYFELVRAHMGRLFAEGKVTTIEEAYKVASAPIEQRLAAQAAGRQQRIEADRLAALEKAKRAQPVRTSGIAPGGRTKVNSIDDAISAAMSQVGPR